MTKRKRISGLPRGHVPGPIAFADRSHLFGSHASEAESLTRQAKDAEWSGDLARADRLFAAAAHHRSELAEHGDLAPLF